MSRSDMTEGLVPAACTLPTLEQPTRVAEFDDVFRSLLGVERPDHTRLVLRLEPAPGSADVVRDLTRRETECCSFFAFTLIERPGLLLLEVAVPPQHADVLDSIADRATRLSGLAA